MTKNKKISNFLGRMIPEFVVDEYGQLTKFLQAYFDYLDQDDSPMDYVFNSDQYGDIDSTTDTLLDNFRSSYIDDIPESMIGDARHVIKHIRDYYISKGNVLSYEMLFKIVYGVDVEIYYPKVDILRASDGRWYEPFFITVDDSLKFEHKFITSTETNARGFVTSITSETNPKTIDGVEFLDGETFTLYAGSTIFSLIGEGTVTLSVAIVDGIPTEVELIAPNIYHYMMADSQITVSIVGGARLVVSSTQPKINKLNVTNITGEFNVGDEITTTDVDTGEILFVERATGRWLTDDGFLSSKKKLQDNYYYQDYSYEISTDIPKDVYLDTVNKIIHPTGLQLFGKLNITPTHIILSPTIAYNHFDAQWTTNNVNNLVIPASSNIMMQYNLTKTLPNNTLGEYDYNYVSRELFTEGDYYINKELNLSTLKDIKIDKFICNDSNILSLVHINGMLTRDFAVVNRDITLGNAFNGGDVVNVKSLSNDIKNFQFDGDGSITTFDLGANYNKNDLLVYVDGIKLKPLSDYYTTGNNLIFTTSPSIGINNIQVYKYNKRYTMDTFDGDGSNLLYNVPKDIKNGSVNSLLVYVDGILSGYKVKDKTTRLIELTRVPSDNADNVEIYYLEKKSPVNKIIVLDGTTTEYRLDNLVTQFKYRGNSHITITT